MSWKNWLKQLWQPSTATKVPPAGGDRAAALRATDASGNPIAVRLRIGAVSTVGNHREHNEDNYYVAGHGSLSARPEGLAESVETVLRSPAPSGSVDANGSQRASSRPDLAGPFIVADGLGGQLAGEQASRIAVELIPKELANRIGNERESDAIRHAIAAANREIIAQAHVVPECANMGTTVVVALFRPGRVLVAGIGDSRVYRVRDGGIERLTRDHDLASALITAGTIRPEEAEKHQFRHILYLYLGSPEARDGPEDVREDPLLPGDRFLLASDGLTGVVSDAVIAEMLGRRDDPQTISRELVELALRNESRDNVTCMVIAVDAIDPQDQAGGAPSADPSG